MICSVFSQAEQPSIRKRTVALPAASASTSPPESGSDEPPENDSSVITTGMEDSDTDTFTLTLPEVRIHSYST